MTDRLYYTDAYLAEFDATVVDRAEAGRRVYLDRTAFYPTSGGQPHDTGRLGGVEVVDVVDEGGRIAHLLAEPLLDERVAGCIDWARRFDHMQQHTGQHLLSAVLHDRFGWQTTSVHFGRETSTLDLDTGAVTPEQLAAAEDQANVIVFENRPLRVIFEVPGQTGELRKPSAREGMLRIVIIDDLDRNACGGTHVSATGAVGAIQIRRVERVKRSVRLEFVCGARAVRAARHDRELLARMSALASAAPAELPAILEAQRAELKAGSAARREAEAQLDRFRARDLYASAGAEAPSGARLAVLREEEGSLEALRGLAQAYTAHPRAVLVAATLRPPGVLLATSEDTGRDAGALLKAALGAVGGRGGGTARLAQGTVPTVEALEKVLITLSASAR